jgi:hypothetical protein
MPGGFPQQQYGLYGMYSPGEFVHAWPRTRAAVNGKRTTDKESHESSGPGCRNRACYKALTIRAEAWLVRADHPRLGWICRKRVCIESDRKQ